MSALTGLSASETCGRCFPTLLGNKEDKDAASCALSSPELLDPAVALELHARMGRPGHERPVKLLIGTRPEPDGAAPRMIQVVALPLDIDPAQLAFAAVSRRSYANPAAPAEVLICRHL